jgi:uncharacterized protein (DUF2252 family)
MGRIIRRSKLWVLAASMGVMVLSVGCSGTGFLSKSPSQVVVASEMAGNAGKYSEARSYIAQGLQQMIDQRGGDAELKRHIDEDTKNGTIARVEILKEEIRGEGASVSYRIYYKDGQTRDDNATLIKEKGEWKLSG